MNMIVVVTTIGAIFMTIFVMFLRIKAAKKPVTAKKIILPPIFMSTGALMFVHPMFRVTPFEIGEATIVGMFFSILLIKTSNFEVRDSLIYLKRSKAFIFILILLLVIRVIAKLVLSTTIDVGELGGMFWILAFGMIVPWRVAMLLQFNKLKRGLEESAPVKS